MRRKAIKPTPVPAQCSHGYSEKFRTCLICHKDPGQCDYGTCTRTGTDHDRFVDGRRVETRALCAEHVQTLQQLDGASTYSKR